MFKIIAKLVTRNSGVVSTEQFFTEGEKELAVSTAARLEKTEGYSDVRLLDFGFAPSLVPVAVSLPLPGEGVTEFKRKRLPAVKFEWVKFSKPAPKTPRKPKKVAASVNEFDAPAAPKKRTSKRERQFGPDAAHRTPDAVLA